jgi:hypothetical protein
MRYFLSVLASAALVLLLVVMLNWRIDPAGIFGQVEVNRQYAIALPKALQNSEYGIVIPNTVEDRVYKMEMARSTLPHDCVLIGSSHVMQMGSSQKHRSLPGCKNILNLGVSGATLEDHITLAWLSVRSQMPRKIFLGVDPWTLAYGKGELWQIRYPDIYRQARSDIGSKPMSVPVFSSRWLNLIGFEYTFISLENWWNKTQTAGMVEAPLIDDDSGWIHLITLKDGSFVPSAVSISTASKSPVPIGGQPYKVSAPLNEIDAIADYRLLIKWIQSQGVQPVLLMTPYHPNVWESAMSKNVLAMTATEKIVRDMAKDLNISAIGSYRPTDIGCTDDEFFDFMHPKPSCLAKIVDSTALKISKDQEGSVGGYK